MLLEHVNPQGGSAMWTGLSKLWHELWVAMVFAVTFAIIADALRVGSRLGSGLRKLKNKLAERSVTRLHNRIKALQEARTQVEKMNSDRSLFLRISKTVFAMLGGLGFGLVQLTLYEDIVRLNPKSDTAELLLISAFVTFFGTTITGTMEGLRLTSLDIAEDMRGTRAQIDFEIVALKKRLESKMNDPK